MALPSQGSTRQSDSAHGFTLVELMIAASLLTTALVLVAGSLVSIHNARTLTADKSRAVSHVGTILNELQQANETELLGYVPPDFLGGGAVTVRVTYDLGRGPKLRPPVNIRGLQMNFAFTDPFEVLIELDGLSSTGHTYSVQTSTYLRAPQ